MTHKESKTRLRQLRMQRNVTISELARAVNVTGSSITNMEQNRGGVFSVGLCQRIADYFGLPIEDLFIIERTPKMRGVQPAVPE